MKTPSLCAALLIIAVVGSVHFASAEQDDSAQAKTAKQTQNKGWKKGIGWGWIWGRGG